MAIDLNIFGRYGEIDHEAIAKADLDALSTDERAALVRVIETDAAAKAAEQHVLDTRKNVGELSAAHDAAKAKLDGLRPPLDPTTAAKIAIARANGTELREPTLAELKKLASELRAIAKDDPSREIEWGAARKAAMTAQAIADAEQAFLDAAEALASARAEYHAASVAVSPARTALSDALFAWDRFTKKLSQLDLARDMARRSAEAALKAMAENPEPAGRKVWPIETALANRKAANKANRTPRGGPNVTGVRGSHVR